MSTERSAQSSKMMRLVLILFLAAIGVYLYNYFDLGQLLTFDSLKESKEKLNSYYQENPLLTAGIFFAVYVATAALSLPGAAILTLAGGAIFGLVKGLVIVSFASSIGALLAFLVARYVLFDTVQKRFGKQLAPINEGIEKDGVLYLLTMRLVPVFPFFMVNLLAGLTTLSAVTFYWVSQLGMLVGTAVYVNAGTQLSTIESLGDIISPAILMSFVLLGIFPLIAKFIVRKIQSNKVYKAWDKPKTFDRNMVVIGAGAGGLVTSYIAAVTKADVTLVESGKMGGDCLNYGCVPSKALIRSAKMAKQITKANDLGISSAKGDVDFGAVMKRVHEVIKTIEPHDSVERYTELGVEVKEGYAKIISPWEVQINTGDKVETLTTKNIVVATGARPFVPPIPGLDKVGCLTSDTVWGLTECPERFLILGGGPIGCELAQSFARLGAKVTLVERGPRLMSREDPEVSALVEEALAEDGVNVMTGYNADSFESDGSNKWLVATSESDEKIIPFDELLCAVGRSPRTEGFGLEELGVTLSPRKTIAVDDYLQTNYPNIYAVGDVAGPYQLTHVAAHQAWYAAVNSLFGRFKRFKVDYSVIPWATFTDPEVARVGLSETEAKEQGISYDVTRYDLDDLDRAIADGNTKGFIKVLTVPNKDRILGVTIVGEHAGDLLAEYVLAMKQGLGLNKVLGTIHTYPTLAEANKYVAGQWKKANSPEKLLSWVQKFHKWERS